MKTFLFSLLFTLLSSSLVAQTTVALKLNLKIDAQSQTILVK